MYPVCSGVELDEVFNTVRAEVSSQRPTQIPWSASSVVNKFYFFGPVTVNTPVKVDGVAEAWAFIRDSQNPADFDEFMKTYPNSDLVPTARFRADAVRTACSRLKKQRFSCDEID
jgi:hypothetical protein